MSDDRSLFTIYGIIALGGAQDSIGIPIFTKLPHNHYLSPVTSDTLEIISFQPVHGYNDRILSVDLEKLKRQSYELGDLLPVILKIGGKILPFEGMNLEELSDSLNKLAIDSEVWRDAVEIVQTALRIKLQSKPDRIAYDRAVADTQLDRAYPGKGKLWLDEAIAPADPRVIRHYASAEAAHIQVRGSLLAWLEGVAPYVTRNIFDYYLESIERAARNGVYVEDILAAAIVRRMVDEGYAWWYLVVKFRATYSRGPLKSLVSLARQGDGKIGDLIRQIRDDFFEEARKMIRIDRERILSLTFVADDMSDFPADIRDSLEDICLRRFKRIISNVKKLNDTVDIIRNDRERLKSAISRVEDDDREKLKYVNEARELLSKTQSAKDSMVHEIEEDVAIVDVISKLELGKGREQFDPVIDDIDFDVLGFSKEYFCSLRSIDQE